MKVTLLSEDLQKKLSFVNHALAARSELPILLNFLLVAKGSKLSISATDLEIAIVADVPATIEQEGETTIPGKVFLELITSIGVDKITFETDEKSLLLVSKKTRAKLQTIDASDFPKLYEEIGRQKATAKKSVLENAFSSVVFAAATDTGRPALSGVLMKRQTQGESKGFLLVATDGYRLSLKTQNLTAAGHEEEKDVIISARLIKELLNLKAEGEEVHLYISEKSNQVVFATQDTKLIGRLIEATYPNYEKIIPNDFATRVTIDRQEMQKAVKTCAIFARETANIIKFAIQKDKITVSANATSIGENSVDVDAKVSGEENEIAFNARYLLDLFANVDAETMVFEMTGPLNPGVFKIESDISFLHIIMPIRVQG